MSYKYSCFYFQLMFVDNQIKILIPIPVLLTGGTEIQTLNLVRLLVQANYKVVVLCYYEYEIFTIRKMEELGAEVILLNLQREGGLSHLLLNLLKKFRVLSPDLIHVQYVAPGFVPIVAARLAGTKKIIATVHQPARTHGFKARLLLRLAAELSDLFLCVSMSTEESWFGNSALFRPALYKKGRKHFTIYNAVDTESIINQATSNRVHKIKKSLNLRGKKIVGYVGRLRWEKGVHVLITAFAEVVSKIPEAMLVVVGDGPDREKLQAQTNELGISSNIIWLGWKTQKEAFQIYGLIDVIAMPSLFEGFGLTAVEAMAAGVPVVATDVDGLSEIIDSGQSGILTNVDDSSSIASEIIRILSKPDLRYKLSKAGPIHAKHYFSLNNYKESILSAYQQVISN